MLPQAADARTRPRIGRYLITGRIGRGGMGMVYRGLDEALEREVAVKTLTAEGTLDGESRLRFAREARAAAHLQHPNIVTVYELGEDRGLPFIAMELLPGTDLEALLRSGEEIPLAEKLDVVVQVCRGLAYAHERGIVHRDIKPSNVRLLEDGTAKIMDFGIAKYGDAHLTKTGTMVGTVHYMSPEQVQGRHLDGRSDVFSVGVILYELLAGERPFGGEGATQVLYRIVNEEPPPLDLAALGEAGPALQSILALALAKDPDQRYPGAAALGAALGGVLEAVKRAQTPPPPLAVAALAAARKAAPGGTEESVTRLQGLVATYPGFLDARRALRTALREQKAVRAPATAPEAYPELEATFQAEPTRQEPGTGLRPTVTISGAPMPVAPAAAVGKAATPRGWLWLAAVLVGIGAIAAALLLRGVRPSAPAEVRVGVRSQPMGASVLLDGRETGVVTNGELVVPSPVPPRVVLTFRKSGHRDETRTVPLPLPAGEAVSVTLQTTVHLVPVRTQPPGAAVTVDGARVAGLTPLEVTLDPAADHRVAVSLDGHVGQEVRVEKGAPPAAIDLVLEKLAPAGTVAVSSSYPVDVLWHGRALARGESSPRVAVPGGRQVLTLVSSSVFLKAEVTVEVPPGGEVPLPAPLAGKLNVRAVPDNCEVFVDGSFVDYPPILERLVAAGRHTVSFRWPDGTRKEQVLEVKGAASNFVYARKDQP
jgi:hypothetical protein